VRLYTKIPVPFPRKFASMPRKLMQNIIPTIASVVSIILPVISTEAMSAFPSAAVQGTAKVYVKNVGENTLLTFVPFMFHFSAIGLAKPLMYAIPVWKKKTAL